MHMNKAISVPEPKLPCYKASVFINLKIM